MIVFGAAALGGLLPGTVAAVVITAHGRRWIAARRRAFEAEMITARREIADRAIASGDPITQSAGTALRDALNQRVTSAPVGGGHFLKRGGQAVMGPLQPRPPVQQSPPPAPPK